MLRKSFKQMKRITFVLLLLFVALVFMQGCGKPSLDRGKAAEIIAESMYPPVVWVPKSWEIQVSQTEESPDGVPAPAPLGRLSLSDISKLKTKAEEMQKEMQKLGINASIKIHQYSWPRPGSRVFLTCTMNILPKQWQPILLGEREDTFHLAAFKNVNVKVTGIAFNQAKNEAEVDFQWEWYNPTEPMQLRSKYPRSLKYCWDVLNYFEKNGARIYTLEEKGEGKAFFKLYDDGWKVSSFKVQGWSYGYPPAVKR